MRNTSQSCDYTANEIFSFIRDTIFALHNRVQHSLCFVLYSLNFVFSVNLVLQKVNESLDLFSFSCDKINLCKKVSFNGEMFDFSIISFDFSLSCF